MAKAKKSQGRPLARAAKSKRYMIRCSEADLQAWEQRATELGFASAGAWLQRLANQALAHPGL